MSWDPQSRNNVLTGAFLIAAVLMAVVVSFVLAEVRFERRTGYTVLLPVEVGAFGLSPGSTVFVGGLPAGQVTRVRLDRDQRGRPHAALVDIRVRSDLVLFEDARVYLERPLVGTVSTLNIAHPGGADGASMLGPDGRLRGAIAPPAFLAGAGFGEPEAAIVTRLIEKVEIFIDEANRVAASVDLVADPGVVNARAAIADLREATARFRSTLDTSLDLWSGDVTRTLASAREAADRAPAIAESVERSAQDIERLTSEARDALATARAPIESASMDLAILAESVRTNWEAEGPATIAAARAGVEAFETLGREASTLLTAEGDALVRILANGRLASDQLKLAAIEIRAAPWRLLNRPDTRELESQLLYDAARAYALAASDLRAASDRLRALTEGAAPDPAAETARDALGMTLDRFQAAERRLLELMIERR